MLNGIHATKVAHSKLPIYDLRTKHNMSVVGARRVAAPLDRHGTLAYTLALRMYSSKPGMRRRFSTAS
jgi:hypothetical protein